jgi:hypothetical protein
VKSGITTVSSSLLCILAVVLGGPAAPQLDLPKGFTASVYARGIEGARDLGMRPDGTLTLRGDGENFEIVPPTADEPVMVLRVAAELDTTDAADPATLAVQAPRFVQLRWNAGSGELGYVLTPAAGAGIPVSPQTLRLARRLTRHHRADVALAPDGSLFVADPRAGAVWRVRRGT